MEYLCPDIDRLVACHTCGKQTLPPLRLCVNGHVGCPMCVRYLRRCRCSYRFTFGRNSIIDKLITAMQLRCKYRKSAGGCGDRGGGDGGGGGGDEDDACENRWFDIEELRDHYRSGCANNRFPCPLSGCGHLARVETVVEHYESAHGPVEELKPTDRWNSNEITFRIPSM